MGKSKLDVNVNIDLHEGLYLFLSGDVFQFFSAYLLCRTFLNNWTIVYSRLCSQKMYLHWGPAAAAICFPGKSRFAIYLFKTFT